MQKKKPRTSWVFPHESIFLSSQSGDSIIYVTSCIRRAAFICSSEKGVKWVKHCQRRVTFHPLILDKVTNRKPDSIYKCVLHTVEPWNMSEQQRSPGRRTTEWHYNTSFSPASTVAADRLVTHLSVTDLHPQPGLNPLGFRPCKNMATTGHKALKGCT